MAEYALDLDAGQIVHWLKGEAAARRRRKLDLRATREYSAEPVPGDPENGDEPEVATLTTTGILEVQPVDVEHPWMLRIRVDDVVGSHLPEDESVPEDAEEIGLDDFYEDFIVPDTGTIYVSLVAETPEGKHAFDRILPEIVTDRHR